MNKYIKFFGKKILLLITVLIMLILVALSVFLNYFCDINNIPHDFVLTTGIPIYWEYIIVPIFLEVDFICYIFYKFNITNYLKSIYEEKIYMI